MGCFSSKAAAAVQPCSTAAPSAPPAAGLVVRAEGQAAPPAGAVILAPSLRQISERYSVTSVVLGKGGFGEVRLAHRLCDGVKVGVKIISKVKFRGEEERRLMMLEAELHHRVTGHPNVTALLEWLEDPGNFYMVLELATGGELMERIVSMRSFSERTAAKYFKQMALGLNHIHSKLVVHRDLKPENFLLANDSEEAVIKITDFGLSSPLPSPSAVLTDPCGSAFYIAPEIFSRAYTKAVDVWALGVILYLLLSGNVPFGASAKCETDVYTAIKHEALQFGPEWNTLTGHARELVSGLLEKDPHKRYTLEQALAHPWVAGESAPDAPIAASLVESLRTFNAQNKFKKAALKMVASSLSAADVAALRASFHKIDSDNTGYLSYAEMKTALENMGISGGDDVTRSIIENIDADGDGQISYEEFLVAALDRKLLEHQKNIWWAFCEYDLDGDGRITAEEIRQVLGGNESKENVQRMISEFDVNGDGFIDYSEFMM